MKYISIIAFSFLLAILSSCTPDSLKEKVLSVSIEPQKYFLETIVKDKFKVNSIIPAGANPESYDPTPSQMVALAKSKLYFKVGYFSFENVWIKELEKNNRELKIVDSSVGIDSIELHDHYHNDSHTHGHEGADPHTWSSPNTARVMARNMYNAVIEFDQANKEFYTVNYNGLLSEFSKTDSIIKSYLSKSDSRSFIIYHPALSYFAKEYNLNQYSIEHEGKSPSPSQMKDLIDIAKKENIKVVFIQAEYDSKNAETIAKEIGAKVVPVNLLSYNWHEEMIKIARAIATYE